MHRPAPRFQEFVAHADQLMRDRGIPHVKDPGVPMLFSLLPLVYPKRWCPGAFATASSRSSWPASAERSV